MNNAYEAPAEAYEAPAPAPTRPVRRRPAFLADITSGKRKKLKKAADREETSPRPAPTGRDAMLAMIRGDPKSRLKKNRTRHESRHVDEEKETEDGGDNPMMYQLMRRRQAMEDSESESGSDSWDESEEE